MTRARWLGLSHRAPNAHPRGDQLRRDLIAAGRDVLIVIGIVLAALYVLPAFLDAAAHDIARDPAYPAAATAACAPPTEHEQLHVVIVMREGKLVSDCQYVGPRGAYQRNRTGMPEPRP